MTEKKKQGRPPKFSTDELRARLVKAGVDALIDEGVSFGLDAVRLDAAIQRARVPRGSAYRIWEPEELQTPQDEFRRAVLLDVLRMTTVSTGLNAMREAAQGEIEALVQAYESGDDARRAKIIQQLIRVAADANFANIQQSQHWRVYRTAASAATTQFSGDAEIVEAIRFGEEQLIREYADFFSGFVELFRMKPRQGLSMEDFAVSVYALNEGLAMRETEKYRLSEIPLRTGDEGEEEPWTLLALGFEALVWRFFEPVDQADR